MALATTSDRTKQSDTMAGVLGALLTTSSSKKELKHFGKLQAAVLARIHQLEKTYGVTVTRSDRKLVDFAYVVENIKLNPDNLNVLFGDLDFLKLIKHPARAALELGKANGCLGLADGGCIEVLANRVRLLFRNPYSLQVQSWARPYIYDHPDHLGKPTRNKSVFTGDKQKRSAWIHHAFANAIGIVHEPNRIFLYAKCTEQIGLLKNGGGPSDILCVQCDREAAGSSGHYKTKLHGYPYSQRELDLDFAKVPDLTKLLI